MSDLCAPLYVVAGSDEPLTFWCFVEVMNRMVCPGVRYLPMRDRTHVRFAETEFPPRPERDEEAALDAPATVASHGP
jgi:hypothetical protein